MIAHTKHEPTGVMTSAYYTIHPEDVQIFIDAVLPHLAITAQQDGCIYYVFAQDLTDPNTIHLTEAWRDQAALDAHLSEENFVAAVRAVGDGVRVLDFQAERYDIAAHVAGAVPSAGAN